MNRSPGSTRVLLSFAFAWGLLLIVLAFFLPVRTVDSGHDGPQPRDSLVQYFGLAGVLPVLALLAAVGVTAWLLGFGRTSPSRRSRVLVQAITGLLLVVVLVAIAFTHIVGLLAVPLVGALLIAAWTTAPMKSREVV